MKNKLFIIMLAVVMLFSIFSLSACNESDDKDKTDNVCEHVEEIIPAVDATCTKDGFTEGKECQICGEVLQESQKIPATGHSLGEWEIKLNPTCNIPGKRTAVCTVCGEEKEEEIAPEHILKEDEWVISSTPTCTETGMKNQRCERCRALVKMEIPKAPHTYSEKWTIDKEMTCGESGSKSRHCTVCGDKTDITVIPIDSEVAKHNYSTNWTIDTEPNCKTDGSKSHHCTVCGDKADITIIPKTDSHSFNSQGVCSHCGTSIAYTSGLEFELINNGTEYSLYGIGTSDATELYVPAEYQGKPVTKVSAYAFENNTKITKIVLPNSIKELGNKAFSGCSKLKYISLPNSIITISDTAFENCSVRNCYDVDSISHWMNVIRPIIPGNEYNIYLSGNILKNLVFSADITSIPSDAFRNCLSIESVTLHGNINSIGSRAFYNCWELKSISFSKNGGLKTIDTGAFAYCTSLTSVVIPDGITKLGTSAFSGCSSLENIKLPKNYGSFCYDEYINDYDSSYDELSSTLSSIFLGCDKLISTERGVTYIGKYLDSCDTGLTSVKIKDDTIGISAGAFFNCADMESITLPASIEGIGYKAFYGCSGITGVYISDIAAWCNIDFANFYANPLNYAKKLYLSNVLVENLTIPSTVTVIKDYAFWHCSELKTVTFESGSQLESIGSYAFIGCSSLTGITIPSSVTSIGSYAFHDCSGLKTVTFESGSQLESIEDSWAFGHCSELTSITIPSSVTSIGDSAFYGCSKLKTVTFESGSQLESIGSRAFTRCSSLTGITFDDTTTWCITKNITGWHDKYGGSEISVTDSSTNATYLKSTYYTYYWYKY